MGLLLAPGEQPQFLTSVRIFCLKSFSNARYIVICFLFSLNIQEVLFYDRKPFKMLFPACFA